MTTTTATDEPDPSAPSVDTPTATVTPDDNHTDDSTRPNVEAAKYRVRLRETEAERDALRSSVERLHRADAERLAAGALSRPADLWLDGAEPAALVDGEGNVDPELVETAIAGVLSERPQLAKGYGLRAGPSTFGLGDRGGEVGPAATWQDLIAGRH